ncbi:RepB family plasmid replication initiator protein [Vagococcus fluvialis]|uniref:replication initiation protein n=1 Tax=Vagococcus fluvialis TaxID=2738 RepID=UPI003D0D3312
MANEIVKYQNDFNTAIMRTWTEKEMNILFSVVAKIRESNLNSTVFSFQDLKKLTGDASKQTKKEFIDDLIGVSKKLASLNFYEETDSKFSLYILFQTFELDKINETLEVMVHPKFEYVFNKIGMEFTQFELKEFVNINSTYAKTAYRLLKQYRTTGWWKVTIEDFRLLLDVPKSYRPSNIDQKILKPILEQLGGSDEDAIFRNLKITKNKKAGRGRGGVLTGFTFTFEKEKTGEWIDGKYKNKSQRKETLPDWANENVTETPLSAEEEEALKKRIEDLYKKKK